jgi:formylglycine-generating enzyme required for sulfatase activity
MLDGLDEVVSREERGWVRQQIEDLVNHIYPGNQVIVTAREAGYRDNAIFGDDFLRLDVQDLDGEQIQMLVENWCTQLYPAEAAQRTRELMNAIRDINNLRAARDLPPLIGTPLMTTMVVSVKWGETELPRERAKLYEACVKVILRAQYIHEDAERDELVDWGGLWEDQRNWLATLALAMHQAGQAGAVVAEQRIRDVLGQELSPASLEQFLQAIYHRGGLLEEKARLFQFIHLTFQEFLAAYWLAKQRDAAFPILQPHLLDSWWREVFLLTHGIAQADFAPFAHRYLEWLSSQTGDDELRLAGLELAGSALLELGRPHPERRAQQAQRLHEMLCDPALIILGGLRARAGDTLARLGDPRFRAEAWYLPHEPLVGFVEIPAGRFLMGSDEDRDPQAYGDERPQHSLTLPRYYIGRYPVTAAQFRAFVKDHGSRLGEVFQDYQSESNHPVVGVTWYRALQYCAWLTARLRNWPGTPKPLATLLRREGWAVTLPSEAEWEKAARGTEGRIYPWGAEPDATRANYYGTDVDTISMVGCFPAGASPYGCLDMAGNVWEWTRSLYGEYPYPGEEEARARRENQQESGNKIQVVWGGDYLSGLRGVRCASRFRSYRDNNGRTGFRVVVRPCC